MSDSAERVGVPAYAHLDQFIVSGDPMSTAVHRALGAAAVAVIVAGTSIAAVAATSSSGSTTYYACVAKSGTLALTTKGKSCPRHERKITFNARGLRGAPGPRGAAGVGASLVDGKGHVLGSVIGASPTTVQIVTSKGFQVTLSWAGARIVQSESTQIYNAGTCSKPTTYYLLDTFDSTPSAAISTSALVYIAHTDLLLKPVATKLGTATSTHVSPKSYYPAATCQDGASSPFLGWTLAPVSRATAGLPATITAPLVMK
jgi:hypothetical protein